VTLICVTFALFYKLVPNTKVDFSAALVGGSLAGVAWHFYNQLGFLLASRAVSASKIYGGLALIPLLMGGLYVVWLTVLFGAQVAYAFQNRAAYLQEKLAENVNQRGREFVALRLMTCISQRFQRGLPPPTIREISTELGVPSRLAQQVLHTLLAAHLVVEVAGLETGYAPARPLDDINCHHILLAMRATQGQELVTRDEPVRAEVLGEFARIQTAEREVASTVTMLALVNRAQARLQLAASPSAEKPGIPTLAELDVSEGKPATDSGAKTETSQAAPKMEVESAPTMGSAAVIEAKPNRDSAENAAPPLAATTNDDQDETQKFPL
jgi:membrane protein